MLTAEAAIHRSLAWSGSCSGCPACRHAWRSSAEAVRRASVAGDDRGCCDRLLQPLASLLAPAGDEGAVAQFGDRDGGEEDLVAGHQTYVRLEAGASRLLMDALKTPVSTTILTTRARLRRRRLRPRRAPRSAGRRSSRALVPRRTDRRSDRLGAERSRAGLLPRVGRRHSHQRAYAPGVGQPPATKATTT